MTPVRLAVVGAGHLGRIHARLLREMSDVELLGVVDVQQDSRNLAASQLNVPVHADVRDIPGTLDGVVVATPTVTHFEVAQHLARQGVHLLIEKPVTTNVAEAKLLTALAREHRVTLQVGHVERFNAAFCCCRDLVDTPRYIESRRTGAYSGRSTDVGAVLDLMIHDIDLILSLVASEVKSVRGFSQAIYGGHEDVAHAEIEFANGVMAHCVASRCHSAATRTLQLVEQEKQWFVDLASAQVECLSSVGPPCPSAQPVVDESAQKLPCNVMASRYRIPVTPCNALVNELREFIGAIRGDCLPQVTGQVATQALAVAERVLDDARQRHYRWHDASPISAPLRRKAG